MSAVGLMLVILGTAAYLGLAVDNVQNLSHFQD